MALVFFLTSHLKMFGDTQNLKKLHEKNFIYSVQS